MSCCKASQKQKRSFVLGGISFSIRQLHRLLSTLYYSLARVVVARRTLYSSKRTGKCNTRSQYNCQISNDMNANHFVWLYVKLVHSTSYILLLFAAHITMHEDGSRCMIERSESRELHKQHHN